MIARRRSPLGSLPRALEGFVALSGPEQGVDEIVLEGDVDLVRRHERCGSLQQVRSREVVDPRERPAAGGRQSPPRRRRQCDVLRCPELGAVATGLLEVVAEDLVQLDELGPVLLEPGGEALVQLGACGLRQCLVGRVADQEVAKAEAVLAGQLRLRSGLISSLRTSAARRGVTGVLGCERLNGAAVEDLALDRAALEHRPLRCLELVEACREQRLQGRRNDHLTFRLGGHRQHLLDEERVAAGRPHDLSRTASAMRSGISSARSSSARGSSRSVTGQSGRRSKSSGRARQSSRIGALDESRRDVLDQVEERLLAPVDVVEDDDERLPDRDLPRASCERPRRSRPPTSEPPSRRAASGSQRRRPRPRAARRAASGPRRPAST